jgi:hypothetical protein
MPDRPQSELASKMQGVHQATPEAALQASGVSRRGHVHVTRPGILAAAGRSLGRKSQARAAGTAAVAPESYVGMYVLVGVLGGIAAAILWVMLAPASSVNDRLRDRV